MIVDRKGSQKKKENRPTHAKWKTDGLTMDYSQPDLLHNTRFINHPLPAPKTKTSQTITSFTTALHRGTAHKANNQNQCHTARGDVSPQQSKNTIVHMLTPLREANRLKVANVNSSTTKPSMERSLRTINLNKLNNTPDMKSSMPESKPKYPISLFDWKRLFPASPNNRTLLKSNHQKIDQNYVKVGHSFTNALKGIQEEQISLSCSETLQISEKDIEEDMVLESYADRIKNIDLLSIGRKYSVVKNKSNLQSTGLIHRSQESEQNRIAQEENNRKLVNEQQVKEFSSEGDQQRINRVRKVKQRVEKLRECQLDKIRANQSKIQSVIREKEDKREQLKTKIEKSFSDLIVSLTYLKIKTLDSLSNLSHASLPESDSVSQWELSLRQLNQRDTESTLTMKRTFLQQNLQHFLSDLCECVFQDFQAHKITELQTIVQGFEQQAQDIMLLQQAKQQVRRRVRYGKTDNLYFSFNQCEAISETVLRSCRNITDFCKEIRQPSGQALSNRQVASMHTKNYLPTDHLNQFTVPISNQTEELLQQEQYFDSSKLIHKFGLCSSSPSFENLSRAIQSMQMMERGSTPK